MSGSLQCQLKTVEADNHTRSSHRGPRWRGLDEHRVGVVDVGVHAVPAWQRRQLLEASAWAVDRQMIDLARGLRADPKRDHLVIGPERAVEQQCVNACESLEQARVEAAASR